MLSTARVRKGENQDKAVDSAVPEKSESRKRAGGGEGLGSWSWGRGLRPKALILCSRASARKGSEDRRRSF